jgi:hypothetical protein
MKILFLYKYIDSYSFDDWLNDKFALAINKNPSIELKMYGPNMHNIYPMLSVCPYNPSLSIEAIYDMYNFDVAVINTKSRCFHYYNPKKDQVDGYWLPVNFNNYKKIKKVVLEQDYHYEKNDSWYSEAGIDLILQRHYSQSLRQETVPMKWFPFSVDTNIFNPNTRVVQDRKGNYRELSNTNNRIEKIAFVGNSGDEAYIYRRTATNILLTENLGASYAGSKKVDVEYVDILRKYIAYISCGSTYEICAAKNFEIMASGGILFTNKFLGIDLLFPKNSYISYNHKSYDDVLAKAREIINNKELQNEINKNAMKCINECHTHEIRTNQLIKILEEI